MTSYLSRACGLAGVPVHHVYLIATLFVGEYRDSFRVAAPSQSSKARCKRRGNEPFSDDLSSVMEHEQLSVHAHFQLLHQFLLPKPTEDARHA